MLQGFSVGSAPPAAPAYSVVLVGALGGVIISQGAVGGGGISETPTEKRVAADSAPQDRGKRPG